MCMWVGRKKGMHPLLPASLISIKPAPGELAWTFLTRLLNSTIHLYMTTSRMLCHQQSSNFHISIRIPRISLTVQQCCTRVALPGQPSDATAFYQPQVSPQDVQKSTRKVFLYTNTHTHTHRQGVLTSCKRRMINLRSKLFHISGSRELFIAKLYDKY